MVDLLRSQRGGLNSVPAEQHIAGGGGRSAASVSAVVATMGLLSSLLTIADHLVLSPPASPPLPVTLHLHVEPGSPLRTPTLRSTNGGISRNVEGCAKAHPLLDVSQILVSQQKATQPKSRGGEADIHVVTDERDRFRVGLQL